MRPSEDVLNAFYGLADLNDGVRYKSAANLLTKMSEETVRDYTIERLVGGLASSRAGARFGYSTTLSLLLAEYSESWTADRLFQLADKKLDVNDKENGMQSAIGKHLLYAVMMSCGEYKEELSKIVSKEVALVAQFPFLAMSISDKISTALLDIKAKAFKKEIWPLLRDGLTSPLNTMRPDQLFIILRLSEQFGSEMTGVSMMANNKIRFVETDFPALVQILKKTDKCAQRFLLKELIDVSRSADAFRAVYRNVVEKWAAVGDEGKILERIFEIAEFALSGGSGGYDDVITVLSPDLIRRVMNALRGKQGSTNQKLVKTKVREFANMLEQQLSSVTDSKQLMELLDVCDQIDNLDAMVGSRLTEHIVGKLDAVGVKKFMKKALSAPAWSIRRSVGAWATWSAEGKLAALTAMAKADKTEQVHLTIAGCVDAMMKMKVRAGESASVQLADEDEAALRAAAEVVIGADAVKKALKKVKVEDMTKELGALWMALKLWAATTTDDEEATEYNGHADELLDIAQKMTKGGAEHGKVLIDLLMGLLSQPKKHHRAIVYGVFAAMLSSASFEHIEHIIQSLMLSDEELVGASAEDDEDDMDGDMEAESSKSSDEEDDDEEEDMTEDDDSDLDGMGEVDQELVGRLKAALGKAAVPEKKEDGDSEGEDSGVDDEAMFKLDAGLAAAFKAIGSVAGRQVTTQKEKQQVARHAAQLRAKLADLLLFALSSQKTADEVKLALMVPLVRAAKAQLKRASADGAASKKAIELLDILAHSKKLQVDEKAVMAALSALVEESNGIVNPQLKQSLASLASFLFALGMKLESAEVKKAFVDLFTKFMKQEDGTLLSEVATAAIVKYPASFSNELGLMMELSFDEKVRIYRRTEAVQCAVSLMRKDVAKEVSFDKKAVKQLAQSSAAYLSSLVPADVKPRFLASVLKFLTAFLAVANDEEKSVLNKSLSSAVEKITAQSADWKQKKIASACVQLTGKHPNTLIQTIAKQLQ